MREDEPRSHRGKAGDAVGRRSGVDRGGARRGGGLLFAMLAARANGEARILMQAFGSHSESYKKRTWRLVPYVY